MKKSVENKNIEEPADNTSNNRSGSGGSYTIRKQNRPLKTFKNLFDITRKTMRRLSEWEKSQNVCVMPSITVLVLWMTYTAFILFIGAQLFLKFSIIVVLPYGCAVYLMTIGLFWIIWKYQRSE